MKPLFCSARKAMLLSGITVTIFLASCGGSQADKGSSAAGAASTDAAANDKHYAISDLVDLDLSSHGIPVIAKAPKDAQVIETGATEVAVYGGKFFKITYALVENNAAEHVGMVKEMTIDKELNPGFDKLEAEVENGFLKRNTKGKYAFVYGLDAGGKAVIITEGMVYDRSPDKFTDYSPEDVKVMFEAAKLTTAK